MVPASKSIKLLSSLLLGLAMGHAAFAQNADDPPNRVLRLNYMTGNVSMEPAGIDQWAPAIVNRPFTIGDYLYTDQSAATELHTDNAAIRMGENTNAGVLNLTDYVLQLKLTQGDLYVRVHDLDPNSVFEVDTPNAALNLLRAGIYRIHVDPNANTTFTVVRSGQMEVTGGGQAFTLDPGQSVSLSGSDQLAYDVEGAPQPDSFDNWCSQRDARYARSQSARYLQPTVIGGEDMDDYGGWSQTPDYGNVWYPNHVDSGWAPYHNGHWAWIEPWGWTWVDDAPWGFAPFHYGRWVYFHERWGWAPGPMAVQGGGYGYGRPGYVRPVYAPALVAWFGGAHWGISLSIGGGAPNVGWCPLGYGEVYTPSYHVSQNYFRNVNVNNTRVVNNVNITNVYNNVYVNKTVYNQTFVNVHAPNAVMAMPQTSFAGGQPVRANAISLRQDQVAHFQPAQAALVAPQVAPTRQAVAPNIGRSVAAPPAQFLNRAVVARAVPASQPVAFAARQQYLQQHIGQVHDAVAMHQAIAPQRPVSVAMVRQAPTGAKPVAVQQGMRVGTVRGMPGTPGSPVRAVAPQNTGGPYTVPQNMPPQNTAARNPGGPNMPVQGRPNAIQPGHGMPPQPPTTAARSNQLPVNTVPNRATASGAGVPPHPPAEVAPQNRVTMPPSPPAAPHGVPPTRAQVPQENNRVVNERPAASERVPPVRAEPAPHAAPPANHPNPNPPHANAAPAPPEKHESAQHGAPPKEKEKPHEDHK